MTNNLVDFPLEINDALKQLSLEYKMRLLKETHYDAINRVLKWYGKNTIHRLDFDYSNKESLVSVTYYIDKFPVFLIRLLENSYNLIPGFPYLAKITWEELGVIQLGLSKEEYKEIIRKFINRVKQKEMESKLLLK